MSNVLFDKDIIRHDRIIPGQAGDGITLPEYTALRSDLDDLLARPVIDELDDVPNVNASAPADGDALIYDTGTSAWVAGAAGGTLARTQSQGTNLRDDVRQINFTGGLTAEASAVTPGGIHVRVAFGPSGGLAVAARDDHTHSIRQNVRFRFPATGSLSGSTRTLASGDITGLYPDRVYVLTGRVMMQVRGEAAGAGYSVVRLTLNSDQESSPERPRTVAGVQIPATLEHPGVTVTGLSSVAVSAALSYDEGDPIWVGGGDLIITITSNR